jgi:predicted Ser/Thr protein kinase
MMPETRPMQPGDPTRLGRYELLGRLGEGGQGVVYLGRNADTGAQVAVKLLRAELALEASARERFVREATAATRVARFCTAQVFEADVVGDRPYIVSEYVPGPSLHALVGQEGPRTGAALERLAVGTATALVAIHQAGVVHRDFKPHNVLLGPDGPRVIDFGIARALDVTATISTRSIGTPAYMAPEQVKGDPITPAVDLFAWGVTMVFAATGQPAFGQDTIAAVAHRIVTGEPQVAGLPDDLTGLVLACLEKDPARRPKATDVLLGLLGHAQPAGAAIAPGAGAGDATRNLAGAAPTAVLAEGVTAAAAPTTGLGQTAPASMAAATMAPPAAGRRRRTAVLAAISAVLLAGVIALVTLLLVNRHSGPPPATPPPTVSSTPETGGASQPAPAPPPSAPTQTATSAAPPATSTTPQTASSSPSPPSAPATRTTTTTSGPSPSSSPAPAPAGS